MKHKKTLLAVMLLLTGAMAAESAFAWHRGGPRVSIGFGFGYPYYSYPYYYPPSAYYPPYSYYPAPVVVQRPPVYVEQPAAAPQSQQLPSGYWYYCNASGAYYPYVQECASGWQRVAPTPQPGD